MYVVALLAQKGGVGKTTLAVTLGVQAELAGKRVGIVDADPQGTASGWYLARQKNGRQTPIVAAVTEPSRLAQAIDDARADGMDWLFIDTPAGVSELPATAGALADMLLLPCVPSVFNMDAMEATVLLAKRVHKPAYFLVNRGRSKGINDECALALTSAYGLPAVNTHISHRLPIADAEHTGSVLPELPSHDPSVEKGREEFRALWHWLQKQQQQQNLLSRAAS